MAGRDWGRMGLSAQHSWQAAKASLAGREAVGLGREGLGKTGALCPALQLAGCNEVWGEIFSIYILISF